MPAASAARSDRAPTLFPDARAFDTWLASNHASCDGLWLQIAKRDARVRSVTYAEAVDVALCWGWIDSQKRAFDDQHFLQRFTPRRAGSVWSRVNVEKARALLEAGRMQPPGRAEVERAQADGRWARAYDGSRTAAVPDDLAAALDAEPKARAFFASLDAANRYAVLWRIQTAARPETRAARLARLVQMLARGETIHAPRRKG